MEYEQHLPLLEEEDSSSGVEIADDDRSGLTIIIWDAVTFKFSN